MSDRAVDWVQKHSRSKGTARTVLLVIAHHDGRGGIFPSIDTIARGARCRRETVFRCLKILKALGELDWIPGAGRNRTNLYTLTLFTRQAALLPPFPPENSCIDASKPLRGGGTQEVEEKKEEGKDSRASFLEFAREGFRTVHGQPPAWSGKDERELDGLLSRMPDLAFKEWKRRWTNFLYSSDPWMQSWGHSLGFFCSNFDRFIVGPLRARPAGGKHGGSGNDRKASGAIPSPAGKYSNRLPDGEFAG